MIIIAGDSWGCGEWKNVDNIYSVHHAGLSQYLSDDGYQVINLSRPGGSNFDTWTRLDNFLMCNPYANIEKIFVFQTEWDRELLLQGLEVLPNVSASKILYSTGILYIDPDKNLAGQLQIETANGLGTALILNFYQQLSRLSTKYNININVVGGCSDTMPHDLPGLNIACQSFTNLLLNNRPTTNEPVYSFYNNQTVLEFVKDNLASAAELNELLCLIDRSENRLKQWEICKEYFGTDGVHPNRAGHLKLYEFIKQNW